MRKSWQMLFIVIMASLFSIGVTSAALRHMAVDAPEPQAGGEVVTPTADPANPDAPAEEEDKSSADPYDDIAPEDLPPDLQYNADDSVSFPTNI